MGYGAVVVVFLLIKEPERNRFDKKTIEETPLADHKMQEKEKSVCEKFCAATAEMFSNPTCRYCTIGGAFRFFGGYAIGFFMPLYFGTFGNTPEEKDKYTYVYSFGNALVVSGMGFASALLGGIISDKFEKKGYLLTKSQVAVWAGVLGIPTICLCTLIQSNIYFSLAMLGLEYLVAECWISPVITMIINTISPENKAFGTSAFLFLSTISGTISTTLLGFL